MNNYDFKKIEPKWQKYWADNKLNEAVDNNERPKFYCLDMFPYPSGDGLHVGHPEGYTATDIYSRYLRMNGYNVLHPMGWDSFGLPAENYAIKKGIHPKETTKTNISRFKKQIQSLGFSYDWDRELNTADPAYYKWSQWFFLLMYKKGLAYQKEAPVNWCESCKTVLANEQVVDGKCERCKNTVVQKNLKQWFFKITDYADRLLHDLNKLDWPKSLKTLQENWIGKSEGSLIKFPIKSSIEYIEVFTTRPDTLFGASYLVLAPEHKIIEVLMPQIKNWDVVNKYIQATRKKTELERLEEGKIKTGVELKGIKATNPANQEEIPIYIADYVLSSYGSGAIMCVPAHDERDFEFAKKYNLPIKEVIIPKVIDKHDPPKRGVKTVFRKAIQAILLDPKENKVLVLKWKKFPWTTFVTGGIEDGEDILQAAKREILEETGYKNVKFIKTLGGPVESHFFANHKGVNRKAHFSALVFELINDERKTISDQEEAIHDCVWVTWEELKKDNNIKCAEYEIWLKRLQNCDYAFTDEGALINSGKFEGMDTKTAKDKIVKFVRGKNTVQYRLRDWLISRQRYWGAPIPVIYCRKCWEDAEYRAQNVSYKLGVDYTIVDEKKFAIVPVPEEYLPIELPDDVDFKPKGKSPLVYSKSFQNAMCPKCGHKAIRETDTMDGFVDNSWYYYRFCDPNNKSQFADHNKLSYWMPVDLYVGGAEHAVGHLLYSRFFTKVLYDSNYVKFDEPFKKLVNQGLILAEDGRKMSKSLGNVINPDDVVAEYGADTLRMYEMFMGPIEDTKPWDTKGISGISRFLERVWRFSNVVPAEKRRSGEIDQLIKKVTEDILSLKFNTAISAMMIYLNLALNKRITVSADCVDQFIKLLSPFAPHIAEEIWSRLRSNRGSSIGQSPSGNRLGNQKSIFFECWPRYGKISEGKSILVIQVNGKVRAKIEVDISTKQDKIENLAKNDKNIKKFIAGKKIKKIYYIPGKVLSIVI